MINRQKTRTLTRSLSNKTIFERAGISARAYLTPTDGHTLAIFPDMSLVSSFAQDFKAFHPDKNVFVLPEMPMSPQSASIRALLLERGETIKRWTESGGVMAASPGALMASCLVGLSDVKLSLSQNFDPDSLRDWLTKSGYTPSSLVWLPGQFAQRGFILDIYDPSYAMPIRLEFIDDEIERIGAFHPDTQKSSSQLMSIDTVTLHGITEANRSSTVPLIPSDTLIILNDPVKIETQAESFMWLWSEIFDTLNAGYDVENWSEVFLTLSKFPIVRITNDPSKSDAEFPTDSLPSFKGDASVILKLCDDLSRRDYSVEIFTSNPVFQKLPYTVHDENLSSGFVDNEAKKVFISDRELSGINSLPSLSQRHTPNDWSFGLKLSPGQLVIHEDYGTGIFRGVETIEGTGGFPLDVITIEFADKQRLLIPVTQSEKITGLNEHESESSKIDSLRGKSWKKNLQKTQERAQKEAAALMEIFAKRELERREPYAENDEAYDEFVRAFTFNETGDQLKAVSEIMKDLSSHFPMDRLLVGDVGFGKTEVAMRAAFRVVMSGFQVCVLVPTTILAQQHYTAFQSRLSGFPVRVGLLSRFATAKQAREVLQSTEEGKIDILIGTHKLLRDGVKFKHLGLLVIDEEHRFGVMDKESLKFSYGNVDVLSLSATPIPRTLAMALRGLRSISVLSTPPEDRLPIMTYTGQFSAGTVRRAVTFELNRGGQVYFLSCKISRIAEYMKMLTAFFPDAVIKTAHGQMKEKELEATMLEFYDGKIDILVATTIIESGLDVGRANTIIIDNSEELGLAQMYQLRGRVGRRGEKAFAYFFYPDEASLNKDTRERLEAISTMTELGSGYEIARRDLDIRGGGEAGGTNQHGNSRNSSYNIFYKMLEQELDRLRGKDKIPQPDIISDRGSGFIPASYIPQDDVRLTLYRRIINALGFDEMDALCDEIADRFGKVPGDVSYLVGLTVARNFGGRYGIHEVSVRRGTVTVKHKGSEIPERMRKYLKTLGRNVKYTVEAGI